MIFASITFVTKQTIAHNLQQTNHKQKKKCTTPPITVSWLPKICCVQLSAIDDII